MWVLDGEQSPGACGQTDQGVGVQGDTTVAKEGESCTVGTGSESAGPPGTIASGGGGQRAQPWFCYREDMRGGQSSLSTTPKQRVCQKPVVRDALSRHQGLVITLHGRIRQSDTPLQHSFPAPLRGAPGVLWLLGCLPLFLSKTWPLSSK